jgi:nucleoside diphosphate kinase
LTELSTLEAAALPAEVQVAEVATHVLLPRLGYLLLKPDCLLRGAARAVLERVEAEGFEVVDHDVAAYFDPEHVQLLYGSSFDTDHDLWHVNSRAFEWGPTIVVLVFLVEEVPPDEEATSRLNALKGPIMPFLASGTIRGDLGVSSRVLNLVHTPDSRSSLVSELSALVGTSRLLRLLSSLESDEGRVDRLHRSSAHEIADLVHCHGYCERHCSPWRALQHLKLRVLFRFAHSLASSAVDETEVRLAVEGLHDVFHANLADLESAHPNDEAELALARGADEVELHHVLVQAATAWPRPPLAGGALFDSREFVDASLALLEILGTLVEPERLTSPSFSRIWRTTRAAQVYTSPFEQFLIDSALAYFPGPRPPAAR